MIMIHCIRSNFFFDISVECHSWSYTAQLFHYCFIRNTLFKCSAEGQVVLQVVMAV